MGKREKNHGDSKKLLTGSGLLMEGLVRKWPKDYGVARAVRSPAAKAARRILLLKLKNCSSHAQWIDLT